jgi:hypothetical protein
MSEHDRAERCRLKAEECRVAKPFARLLHLLGLFRSVRDKHANHAQLTTG